MSLGGVTPIVHDGREVSLAHLAPMIIHCPCTQIKRNLSIRVGFANHCYTEAFDAALHAREQIILYDSPQRPRIFSPNRHRLSVFLPQLLTELPTKKVQQTFQQRNYVYEATVELETVPYEVYFMLQRLDGEKGIDLRLTVESAYPSEGLPDLRKRPRDIRFSILAYKTLAKQPITFGAR
jgi:hypothetical protein